MHRIVSIGSLALASLAGLATAQNSSTSISTSTSTSLVNILNQNGFTNFSKLLQNSTILEEIDGRTDLTILALNNTAWTSTFDSRYTREYVSGDTAGYYILDGRYETWAGLPNYSYIPTLYTSPAGTPQIVAFSPNIALQGQNYSVFIGGLIRDAVLNVSQPLLNDPSLPVIWPLAGATAEAIFVPPQPANTTLSVITDITFVGDSVNITALAAGSRLPTRDVLTFANNTMLHALQRTNLLSVIDALPNVTVFLPADQAFTAAAAGPGGINSLSDAALLDLLRGHIVNRTFYETDFVNTTAFTATALNGAPLAFTFVPTVSNQTGRAYNKTFVNNAVVWPNDIFLPNGAMHVIDQVLYPNVTAAPVFASSSGYVALPSASSGAVGSALVYTTNTAARLTSTSRTAAATSAAATATTSAAATTAGTSAATTVPTYTGAAGPGKGRGIGSAAAAGIAVGIIAAGVL